MKVLSLFDGISGGQFALKRLGIPVETYYASEIEPHAIAITQYNFPDTIQLGDVKKIKGKNLPKIDLLIGGSPCQSLSIAKRQKESGLIVGESTIFYEYVRLLKEVKPTYFLLENVASMKQSDKDEISKEMGVEPVLINSKDFSGQLRSRLYWTNIPLEPIEKFKSPLDINTFLDNAYSDRKKSYCITATYSRACAQDYFLFGQRQMVFTKPFKLEIKKEKVTIQVKNEKGILEDTVVERPINYYTIDKKTYRVDKKGTNEQLGEIKKHMRKLTPNECEKLQTLDVDYTLFGNYDGQVQKVTNAARYHAVGNGWTIKVIEYLLHNLK